MVLVDIEYRDYFRQDQIDKYREIFDEFDVDGSGEISVDELDTVFRSIGLNLRPGQLQSIIEETDVDQSGAVEFDEFCAMMVRLTDARIRADLVDYQDFLDDDTVKQLIDVYVKRDTDRSGTISMEECGLLLEDFGFQVSPELLEEVWTEVDKDASGEIEFDEFCCMWVVLSKKRRRLNYLEYFSRETIDNFQVQFDSFDRSGDGTVDKGELNVLFRNLGVVLKKNQLEKCITQFDLDNSGEIDFTEFCHMMIQLKGQKKKRRISPATCRPGDLLAQGFTVKDLQMAGFQLAQLKGCVCPSKLVEVGKWDPLDLRRVGYTALELRKAGVGPFELRRCGYSLIELSDAGFSTRCIREVNKVMQRRLADGDFCLAQRHPYDLTPLEEAFPKNLNAETPRIRYHTDYRLPMACAVGTTELLEADRRKRASTIFLQE